MKLKNIIWCFLWLLELCLFLLLILVLPVGINLVVDSFFQHNAAFSDKFAAIVVLVLILLIFAGPSSLLGFYLLKPSSSDRKYIGGWFFGTLVVILLVLQLAVTVISNYLFFILSLFSEGYAGRQIHWIPQIILTLPGAFSVFSFAQAAVCFEKLNYRSYIWIASTLFLLASLGYLYYWLICEANIL